MTLKNDVLNDIEKTVKTSLATKTRNDGTITSVPESANMAYNEGLYLPSTYLYADMADSSGLVAISPPDTVARVMKAFLMVSTRIIRANNGHIRSFDGDRVMGIYAGPDRADRAVRSAMQIESAIKHHIRPAITGQFPTIKNNSWQLDHACGIASGQALLVRAGFRGNDDIISIGSAPNLAAKLSDKRQTDYKTFIGRQTFDMLSESWKVSKGKDMWAGPFAHEMGGKTHSYMKTRFSLAV
ncbi:hypothetical protein CQ017_03960 [Arthrobacter sp. MYb224]|uniref:adenylate/guanylate cyclase domain-containing protein n=1 Tax=Arthrobacter sp. MYb224 TaxID=1848600 RepID=UPI000CFE238C|nr:adenylate/guanylate cyclase domain-containing protein [Arthrobacter sp. MYb224]PRA00195.1 hypothetical protein CQ017_03960 [Arthrobacter sp. MYb224]